MDISSNSHLPSLMKNNTKSHPLVAANVTELDRSDPRGSAQPAHRH